MTGRHGATWRASALIRLWCPLAACVAVVAGSAGVPARASTPGTITTVAGTGMPGYNGDGGPGPATQLDGPRTVAVDRQGNVYVSDTFNNRIRRIDTSGIVTTIAGTGAAGYTGDGGPATRAELQWPHDVYADPTGDVYIADSYNHVIRKVDHTTGVITTVAGNGVGGYAGDGGPATRARLDHPKGIFTDGAGTMWIGDTNSNVIRKVGPDGIITTVAGTKVQGYSGDGGPATSAMLNRPRGIVVDRNGDLIIADRYNFRIRKVNHVTGIITTIAGTGTAGFSGDGGPGLAAQFNDCHGNIALDAAGNLYIPDTLNNRIRMLDPGGVITTVAGNGKGGYSGDGGPATAAQISHPRGAAVDAAGNLYIAEASGDRIREVEQGAAPAPGAWPPDYGTAPTSPGSATPGPGPATPGPVVDHGGPSDQSHPGEGYRMVSSDGGIFAFGGATFHGSTGDIKLAKPIVGMAATPTGKGYWLVASDGGIFAFGDAAFSGSTGSLKLARSIIGMAATPSGKGYWLVASDGGIFAFGDATFRGSTGAIELAKPIVAMAATPTGLGYWLVASDGGIFAFGDAAFSGSTGSLKLARSIIGMLPTRSSRGYWLVASDGGIFAFGDATFHGSAGDRKLAKPIVGVSH